MIQAALLISALFLTIGLLAAFVRFLRGPTPLDRILSFDLVSVGVAGFVVLLSIFRTEGAALDLLLIYSLLGFVTTVFFIDYFLRT